VLNHPEPITPIMDINSVNFGQIVGASPKSAAARELQAQLRFSF
jgi:hypothetical protein